MFDVHCHILPNVDDGSESFEMSAAMLKEAWNCGIDHIVCTPHCRWDNFSRELVEAQFDRLCEYADELDMQLTLGYEVYWKKLSEMGADWAPTLTFEGTNLMLYELSTGSLPPNWQSRIFELQGMGLQLIIAHPERYMPIQKDLDVAYEMKEAGCLLQLSANFVDGGFRDKRKKTAIELLKQGLVDYIASDAHRPEDYLDYREAIDLAQKYV